MPCFLTTEGRDLGALTGGDRRGIMRRRRKDMSRNVILLWQWVMDKVDSYRFWQAVNAMRKISAKNGNCNMTLDEIDTEIDSAHADSLDSEQNLRLG